MLILHAFRIDAGAVSMGFLKAAAIAAAMVSAGSKPAIITNPDWVERPSAEDLAEHYPDLAQALLIPGRATISCKVTPQGSLQGCRSVGESPQDLGFGRAAVAMSPHFKMRPMTVNGQAVEGGEVRIPIRFALPAVTKGPLGDAPADRLPAALRYVDASRMVDGVAPGYERGLNDPSAAVTARDSAKAAMKSAFTAHREDLRQAYARAAGAVFTGEELSAMAAFAEKPPTEVMKNPDIAPLFAKAAGEMRRYWIATAREQFCARNACGSPADVDRVWRPANPRDKLIDNPQWSRSPTEFDVRRAGDKLFAELGVTGAVRLTCTVVADGSLTSCGGAEETPVGMGFAAAGLTLAASYRLSPLLLPAAAGRKVVVRVGFAPPKPAEPFAPPEGGTTRSRALARDAFVNAVDEPSRKRGVELYLLSLQSKGSPGVDAKLSEQALDAFREASVKAQAKMAEQTAQIFAANMSEDDLARMAQYRTSAAGKAQVERSDAFVKALERSVAGVDDRIRNDARAAFCKVQPCLIEPAAPAP